MLIKGLSTLLRFIGGGFFGFLIYSICVAYLVEESLPNHEIAQGFVGNLKMILLIGSLRIGELEEYFIPILVILFFGILAASLPRLWRLNKLNHR